MASLVLLNLPGGQAENESMSMEQLFPNRVWPCPFYLSSSFGETYWHMLSVGPSPSFQTWLKLVHGQDGFGVGEGRGLVKAGS